MKPISVEFQAFGPYSDLVVIDYRMLSQQGLFLICGETGSGKTMILDAMMMALYGESSGGGRNSLEELRCNRCPREKDTMVAFTFEKDGVCYRFERRLEMKRVNLAASQNVYTIHPDGTQIPLFQNGKEKEVNAKAIELIGLTADQFRQVVILPQGQFEKFLTSSTEEKEQILNKIFNTSRWERIAETFFKNAKAASDALEEQKRQMDYALANLSCDSMEDLSNKLALLEQEIATMQEEFAAKNYEAKRKELDAKKQLSAAYAELHDREQDLQKLICLDEKMDRAKEDYQLAQKAEPLRAAMEEQEKTIKAQKEREKSLADAQDILTKAREKSELAAQRLAQEQGKKPEYDQKRVRIGELGSKREIYASMDSLREQMTSDEKQHAKAIKACQQAEQSLQYELAQLEVCYQKMVEAQQEQQTINARYMAGLSGELAQKLVEGEACPVCGSTHHPQPAAMCENHATAEEVEEAQEKVELTTKAWKAADQNKNVAQESLTKAKQSEQEAGQQLAASKAKYEASLANMVEDIANLKELEDCIQTLQEVVEDYDLLLEQCTKQATEAQGALAQAERSVKTAKEEAEQAQRLAKQSEGHLQELLSSNGWDVIEDVVAALRTEEEREKLHGLFTEHQTKKTQLQELIAKKQEELKDTQEIPLQELEKEATKLQEAVDQYHREHTLRVNRMETLKEKQEELRIQKEEYDRKKPVADSNLIYAKRLRGDTGIGLKRYVLAIMFTNVVAAANEMLEKVHGGRYRLYRTDDKVAGSNKKGLNLKVVDHYSEDAEGRNVATLSGGEKFLVSLSLAIGMSTIAQTSGVHIEAMFIDEGFGSLDQNSIEDALDVLNSIRKANGLVGIISHVEILRSNIPTKVMVEKKRNTSSVHITVG